MPTSVLESLGSRLAVLASPPSIRDLMSCMEASEEQGEFMRLVRQYTPEMEPEIKRAHGPAAKMLIFAQAFERHHFPLWYHFQEGGAEEYSELVQWPPSISAPRASTFLSTKRGRRYTCMLELNRWVMRSPKISA